MSKRKKTRPGRQRGKMSTRRRFKSTGSDKSNSELISKAQAAVDAGNMEHAIRIFSEAIDRGHKSYGAFHCLAKIYLHQDRNAEALKWLKLACDYNPRSALLHCNIGKALGRLGRFEEAVDALKTARRLDPAEPTAQVNLAEILLKAKKYDEAAETLMEAADKQPEAVFAVTNMFKFAGKYDHGEKICDRLLEIHGPNPAVYNELGIIYQKTARISLSRDILAKAVELKPDDAKILSNYGNSLTMLGRMDEGIEKLARAIELSPENSLVHSNYIFNLHYLPALEPKQLYEAHRRWGQKHAPLSRARTSFPNSPDPARRLRVGYLSPDFRLHSVAYFFESILDGYDPNEIEIYAYGHVGNPDAVTERLKSKCDCYRDIFHLDDEQVIRQIREDQLDILVELTGHTGDTRIALLARKLAPIQITYLGYPDTTGMEAIDYRLTDKLAETSSAQEFYTERLVHLPGGFLCYRPPDFAPDVAPPPAENNGWVTFGSFNNQRKINPLTIALWAEVLKANETSRMLLKVRGANDEGLQEFYWQDFEKCGVPRERVEIIGPQLPVQHLETYGRVDIALDTYPYHGTTTTCEALWMGVPVITLIGQHHASRVGLSILSRLGMEMCAAFSPAEFIAKASKLADQADARAGIRATMRQRMAGSRLCDPQNFCRNLEAAYRAMWREWCEGRKGGLSISTDQSESLPQPADRDDGFDRMHRLAMTHYQQQHLDEARQAYEQLTRKFPDNPRGWNDLGLVYFNTGSADEGISCLLRSLQIKPDDRIALGNLAGLYALADRWDEAFDTFRQLYETWADVKEMLQTAERFKAQGRDENVRWFAQQALAAEPDNLHAKKLLEQAGAVTFQTLSLGG